MNAPIAEEANLPSELKTLLTDLRKEFVKRV